jgi:hypothetical protein
MSNGRRAVIAVVTVLALAAQETPKKKKPGFLERLGKKIDEIDKKLDPPGQPPAEGSGRPGKTEPQPAQQAQGPYQRPKLNAPCTPSGWKRSSAPDPANDKPPGYEMVFTTFQPEPTQPPGEFTLEELGRTKSLRVYFPPRKVKEVGRARRQGFTYEYRDPSPPFEVHLVMEQGRLAVGFCDENGVYRDGSYAEIRERPNPSGGPPMVHDLGFYYTERPMGGLPMSVELDCPDCYFVNQIFSMGLAQEKVVIFVHPGKQLYFPIRLMPYRSVFSVRPLRHLCPPNKCEDGVGPPVFEREEDLAHETLYPGLRANEWYVKCQGCPPRTRLDYIVSKQESSIAEGRR